MENIELKPCPLCNSLDIRKNTYSPGSNTMYSVQCCNCGCSSGLFSEPIKSIEFWSRRQPHQEIKKVYDLYLRATKDDPNQWETWYNSLNVPTIIRDIIMAVKTAVEDCEK